MKLNDIVNLIYPQNIYCICCSDMLPVGRPHALCDECISNLSWFTANPFDKKIDEFNFDRVLSLVNYDMNAQTIIHKMKFQNRPYIAKPVGRLMGELYAKAGDIFVAVPMYKEKEAVRGYNQAALLAEYAAKACGSIYIKDVLVKTKPTVSMRSLAGDDRRQVIRDSIRVVDEKIPVIKGKTVVLVDDVITTGTTADICAEALKKAGASYVIVLSFAAVDYKGN